MRLIDVDALIDTLDCSDWAIWTKFTVDEQPTIDAVPVTRCRDCKHYHADTLSCDFTPHAKYYERPNWYEDDFCSYGERRDTNG